MFLLHLPDEIFYHVCKHLSFIDILNLSKTCKQLYVLLEKDNYFWMILIKNQFGSKIYRRYVHEIFNNEKNSDYALYCTDKDKKKFEEFFRKYEARLVCFTWLLNMLNGRDSSDGYLAYTSVIKRKLRPRTKELKMCLTIEQFIEYYLNRNQYLNRENIFQIPFYKLVYSYLVESKRLLAVDLFGMYLRCTLNHLRCTDKLYSEQEYDLNSSTGRCVRLYTIHSLDLYGIKGKFRSILPGIYEIICRIKLDKNEEYLAYYNQCCSKNRQSEKSIMCYFYALAEHGLDCERKGAEMNFNWFESNYSLYGNQNWFNESMGKIQVFELSDIYFGFKIAHECCYRNILFDYIELNIVE